ncbi:hypothetical protein GXW82_08715 [Streptacidiphilus sp. 4-A2]|nr:hypothetical protein [Streptacidiphilus sp. 4-A2]
MGKHDDQRGSPRCRARRGRGGARRRHRTGSAQAAPVRPAVAAAAAKAPALSPGQVGTLRIGEAGLPSTVKIGQTVTMTVWFDQNSRYLLDVGGYGTGVWTRTTRARTARA